MTARERIIAVLNRKEPDRIPIDLGATESSGIMAIAYNRLKKHLGISSPTYVFDMMQMIAKVEPAILEFVRADAIPLLIEPKKWKPWTLSDASAAMVPEKVILKKLPDGQTLQLAQDKIVLAVCPANGFYFDPVFYPLENAKTTADIDAGEKFFESFDWPAFLDENYDDLKKKAKLLYEQTDYAVVANLYVHLFAAGHAHRGFENFMVDLVADKPLAHRLLSRQLEAYLPRIEKYLDAVGPYVDIIQVNDDLGGQNSPLISPEVYREMIKPYHEKLWGYIKEKSGKPILLHSCGSIYELIGDLIEIGVDALNPIQVSAENMDTKKLKTEFGKDIIFWGGGCDTQNVLAQKTPEQVKQEVARRVEDLAPGGGFVFCQVHNIQADVPVENIIAMYEKLRELS